MFRPGYNPNRTEQNRTEQNRTEQNRTEQNRTDRITAPFLLTAYTPINSFV